MRRVSFQGEHGAYSESAALALFPDAKTIPCESFAAAAQVAESGEGDCALIPVENSLAGSVGESYDILRTTALRIVGETYHQIRHCLIGRGSLEDVRTVYSHPQALGQCRRFIESRHIRRVPTYDTAGSVRMVMEMGDDAACIASAEAARLCGMPVIMDEIANEPQNHTRFVVLSRDSAPPEGANKTSFIASMRHERGALHALLGVFESHGINLTRIESRPKREGTWEYDFFIDAECDPALAAAATAGAVAITAGIKSLGSYVAARAP